MRDLCGIPLPPDTHSVSEMGVTIGWEHRQTAPLPSRSSHSATLIGEEMIIIGGESGESSGRCTNDVVKKIPPIREGPVTRGEIHAHQILHCIRDMGKQV